MPEIPEIGVGRVGVKPIGVQEIQAWRSLPPQSIPSTPPITSVPGYGFPVADVPGCVESRSVQPGNKSAYDNDPRGNVVLCHGAEMPSFNALDFTPGTLTYTRAKPPAINPEKKPADKQPAKSPSPGAPPTPDIPNVATELPCPPPDAIPIGAKNKQQTAIVTGYKLINGKCETQFDTLDIPTIVGLWAPSAPAAFTTAGVAAIGVTSAILAKPLGDILLKAIKPIVKKTIKKIKEKLGKKVIVESDWQRRRFQRSLKK